MTPRAVMVTGITCDSCRTVYVLHPEVSGQFDRLRGEALAAAVRPLAEDAGWRRSPGDQVRCPRCVERHGSAEAPHRPGWREMLHSAHGPHSARATRPG